MDLNLAIYESLQKFNFLHPSFEKNWEPDWGTDIDADADADVDAFTDADTDVDVSLPQDLIDTSAVGWASRMLNEFVIRLKGRAKAETNKHTNIDQSIKEKSQQRFQSCPEWLIKIFGFVRRLLQVFQIYWPQQLGYNGQNKEANNSIKHGLVAQGDGQVEVSWPRDPRLISDSHLLFCY